MKMNECQGWALGGGAMKVTLERGRTRNRRYYATELFGYPRKWYPTHNHERKKGGYVVHPVNL